ncbi:SIMPL domain-containing protein [Chloroflexota bacterium]
MKKTLLICVGLASILAVVFLAGCAANDTAVGDITELNLSSQQQGIWVNGEGKVTAVPDLSTLRLGIETEAPSVAEAQSQATVAMDEVMKALDSKGIAEKDIQTQHFNIHRVTKWDRVKEEEVVTGYRVANTVIAKIRNIEKAGAIIDAVVEAGGDLTRIDSIDFSIEDSTDYYARAREEAMDDAKTKAQQLAKLAGVSLGKPTYISENVYGPMPKYIQPPGGIAYAEAEMAVETSISPGELELGLSVQIAYDIMQ